MFKELSRMHSDAPGYTGVALLLLLALVPTLAAYGLDPRTIDGVPGWNKPVKFQLALFVYCLTLAFYARFIPAAVLLGRLWRGFTALVLACILAETVWLMYAASLGERSHFNFDHHTLAIDCCPRPRFSAQF